jgi:hypothetical protein
VKDPRPTGLYFVADKALEIIDVITDDGVIFFLPVNGLPVHISRGSNTGVALSPGMPVASFYQV